MDTLSAQENKGWETKLSATIKNVWIDESKDNVLRLEFIHGAGFELDALEFAESATLVSGINISSCPAEELIVDSTHQLMAMITPSDVDDLRVVWSSSNDNIATVNENGLVTAISPGNVSILASSFDLVHSDSCEINIAGGSTNGIEFPNTPNVKVYPNPASNELFFDFARLKGEKQIKLYNPSEGNFCLLSVLLMQSIVLTSWR